MVGGGVASSAVRTTANASKQGAQSLVNVLTKRLRQRAGFKNNGEPPLILDSNINPGLAKGLRETGRNARHVKEIFGKDPGDKAINRLASQLQGKVVSPDRARDFLQGGGFRGNGIPIPGQVGSNVKSIIQFLEKAGF